MDGEIGADSVLDCAVFQISSAQNSYEALICCEGKIEKIAYGALDQLSFHLPQVKGYQSNSSNNSFKLELRKGFKISSWFTKFTLARFLNIINSPDAIRSANAIANEMSQLEDTRRFHLSLNSKAHSDQSEGKLAGGHPKDVGSTNIKVESGSSDATKNELLRAVELRLLVLKEELAASFNRAAGATLSVKQILDIAKFVEHFEVRDLRDPLSKYLSLIPEDQLAESFAEKIPDDAKKNSEDITQGIHLSSPELGKTKPTNIGVSPAKIAQAERQSSTESENSDSSDKDQTFTERSRPIMRSATPRRSASPMRRVQIGRSGSRRSTALTIKSLSFFPARERIISNRDADENSSGDEQASQPAKKSDNTVRRMSVQEAISLFESKQNDQNLDVQKKRAAGEVSLNTSKSVLRRWSAGPSDSLTRDQENSSEAISQSNCANLATPAGDGQLTDKIEPNISLDNLNTSFETAEVVASPDAEMITLSKDCPADSVSSQTEEIDDKVTASAEWSRQKEEELNQMLMKMMESKRGKYRGSSTGSAGSLSTSNEKRGGFYSQYRVKRDEKLRSDTVKKHSVMEAQLKVLQETLKPTKAELVSKSGVTTKKLDSSVNSQRPRRNSSPPVLNKREVSKVAPSKKASLKSSPIPTTRASWSGPLQKASGTQPAKSSPRVPSANNTTPSRRKSQAVSSTPASPKTERPLHQPKGKPDAKTDVKPTTRGQGEKKQKTTPNTNRTVKTKAPTASADSSSGMAKPSFYNKVTKKSSVVPLEAKPAKKGTGTRLASGPASTKFRITQSDVSSKRSDNSIQAEEKEATPETTEPTAKVLEVDLAQQANDVDANLVTSLDNDLNLENTEKVDQSLAEVDNDNKISVELPAAEIQPDEDISISSAAWVEVEHQELSTAYDTRITNVSTSTGFAPTLLSSPRVRHSLSQMLQADSNEPDVIEWGNAENPPALIYHKDAPKGLKRLLKFARKSKGEANVTGWASPSVFSEGEDDAEDSKALNRKNLDTSRKISLQSKGCGQQKTLLNESLHDGNSSKRSVEYHGVHDVLSGSDKFREAHISSAASSTKAARSFFSLSTFRSSKSNETKPR
ncbi:muscle M-line assembly protein unc-89-like isoform X1 [Canna indica]|uniref:Muscle M-line assembly protein unc-89-like isoform X1 n=1 Tax=Canna indica TaxID=4628 RepID=A0AAQ3JTR8_9LILI|nr:muscle M-line assembly protein unc-89-like isoform X1 [Canna indica]